MTDFYNDFLNIIKDGVKDLNRDDLYREPILGISTADDPLYLKLKELIGSWHKTPVELFSEAKAVISYFVPFTKEVTKSPTTAADIAPQWAEAYVVINDAFEGINDKLSSYLQDHGYGSYKIAATHTYDPKVLKSLWSHRSAAVVSGLGQFGANTLVITDKGSSGRFCTLLTSAPIAPTAYQTPVYCFYEKDGTCLNCVKKCPVSALEANNVDKFNCHDNVLMVNAKLVEATIGFADACGKCISSCPVAYLD